jgi:histone arginine demethylase JMJD6
MGWRSRLSRARRLHRPDLKDWEQDGLYEKFPEFANGIIGDDKRQYEHFVPSDENASRNIPVVLDAASLSTTEFFDNYEAKGIPCVIKNIPSGYDGGEKKKEWHAVRNWGLEDLEGDDCLRNRLLKCGEDDDGRKIKVKLKHFLSYVRNNRDDSPLYIFDTSFDEDELAKRILTDYTVPSYFRDDLFRFISESRRPPYRWFLVGPTRSGTTVHIDPLATAAWNTLLHGKKRWVLFPPHVPKHIVKGKNLVRPDEDDEAIHYFMFILPRIKHKVTSLLHHDDYRGFACYEFTQNAGETVFVPNGWWQ